MESKYNRIKISIIVPIYNTEKYLKKCLDSILDQTYKNIEIILVNDGSTDNSGNICNEYVKKDNRFKVIHCKNGGVAKARNIGLSKVSGDYIGFVDSDDYIEPFMFESMLKRIIKDKSNLVVCGRNQINGKNITSIKGNDMILKSEEALKLLIEDNIVRNHLCSILCGKEFYNDIYFEEGKIYEDVRVICKLFIKAKNISLLGECCYNYVIRTDSLSNEVNVENWMDLFNALRIQKKNCIVEYPQLEEDCVNREIRHCFYMLNVCQSKGYEISSDIVKRIFMYLSEDLHYINSNFIKGTIQLIIYKNRYRYNIKRHKIKKY